MELKHCYSSLFQSVAVQSQHILYMFGSQIPLQHTWQWLLSKHIIDPANGFSKWGKLWSTEHSSFICAGRYCIEVAKTLWSGALTGLLGHNPHPTIHRRPSRFHIITAMHCIWPPPTSWSLQAPIHNLGHRRKARFRLAEFLNRLFYIPHYTFTA